MPFQEKPRKSDQHPFLSPHHAYSTRACNLLYSQGYDAGTRLHLAGGWAGEEIFDPSPALPLQGH